MAEPLDWATVTAVGRDAASFLDGQLAQDLRAAGDGAWSCLLEPTGVVLTAGWVTGSGDTWSFAVPAPNGPAALARLTRFRLRTKCELALTAEGPTPPLRTEDDRFTARWPGPSEFARELVPHAFGATFVARTISFTKGCFTGQELVGRMDARGASMPWRLVVARGPSAAAIDERLQAAGPAGPKGVTSSHTVGDVTEALGIAHRSIDLDDGVVALEFVA